MPHMSSAPAPIRLTAVTLGSSPESTTMRLAERFVTETRRQLGEAQRPVEASIVNVQDHLVAMAHMQATHIASTALSEAFDTLADTDALIVVSPTYNGSYAGALKMFWDLVEDGLVAGVPTVVAATGGTERHSLMVDYTLRPLFSYLKAHVMPTGVFIATPEWAAPGMASRIARSASELTAAVLGSMPTVTPIDATEGLGADGAEDASTPAPAAPLDPQHDPRYDTAPAISGYYDPDAAARSEGGATASPGDPKSASAPAPESPRAPDEDASRPAPTGPVEPPQPHSVRDVSAARRRSARDPFANVPDFASMLKRLEGDDS